MWTVNVRDTSPRLVELEPACTLYSLSPLSHMTSTCCGLTRSGLQASRSNHIGISGARYRTSSCSWHDMAWHGWGSSISSEAGEITFAHQSKQHGTYSRNHKNPLENSALHHM